MASITPSSQTSRIASSLAEQQQTSAALLEVLSREYETLSSTHPENLEAIVRQKQELLARLGELDQALRATITAAGFGEDSKGLEAFLRAADTSGRLQQQWRKVADTLRECETQNQVNGGLLELSQRQVEQALTLLRGQPQEGTLYSADGHRIQGSRSRPLAEA